LQIFSLRIECVDMRYDPARRFLAQTRPARTNSTPARQHNLKPKMLQLSRNVTHGFVSKSGGTRDGKKRLQSCYEIVLINFDSGLHPSCFAKRARNVNARGSNRQRAGCSFHTWCMTAPLFILLNFFDRGISDGKLSRAPISSDNQLV